MLPLRLTVPLLPAMAPPPAAWFAENVLLVIVLPLLPLLKMAPPKKAAWFAENVLLVTVSVLRLKIPPPSPTPGMPPPPVAWLAENVLWVPLGVRLELKMAAPSPLPAGVVAAGAAGGLVTRKRAVGDGQRAVVIDGAAVTVAGEAGAGHAAVLHSEK